jgi:uncharacterized protein
MKEITKFAIMVAVFLGAYFFPVEHLQFLGPIYESLALVRWYAREHVILCLVPALFIAGAITVFAQQGAILKYLGPDARRIVAYPVAAISGGILAVCSCTVLPLFAGIRQRGAGLGPAAAFLYAGPAINVLAIILTAQVLGVELGIARAVGAIVFAVAIGIGMQLLFRREEAARVAAGPVLTPESDDGRSMAKNAVYFVAMIGVLVFANWGRPPEGATGLWAGIHAAKWVIAGGFAAVLAGSIWAWFSRDELVDWTEATWDFTKQIMPLLLAGVAVAGFLLGGPGSDGGIIPTRWISGLVGGNSLGANFFASVVGAFMYFATLTEVPILAGLLAAGMGKGPALALLLAGPALSLPNMLVIRSVIGTKQTAAFVMLVIVFSTVAGVVYGALF